ncbi:hypothetical protein HBI56_198940 [Parastagonospora nodorum]|nr:hypothetical protein HBH53_201520 [Parastagonospora nodorum]KAH3959564.1 hypothetical protein HBH51_199020 [Parastagonospora nodorum]KAH3964046.1 hypothetical protein HBH52_214630 [Parastagonospora nodorum]KAH3992958.1 hypothetical protein HBI10_210030 [Parastagonospora nodorum]KAH4010697.1 hypothetical protein HBI13_206170 [Parastagonospora nodorum]
MAARDRLHAQILPKPNESVRFVAKSLRRVPSRMHVGNLTSIGEQEAGNQGLGRLTCDYEMRLQLLAPLDVSDEQKEVREIHGAIRDLLPAGEMAKTLGMVRDDVATLYPNRRWTTKAWEAVFNVLPSTRPYKLGFVKFPDTISHCLDPDFFDITIIELSNGSNCSLTVEEQTFKFALCSEAELAVDDEEYVYGILKARLHGVYQERKCWQLRLDVPTLKCANSSYELLMFNFIAGHLCLEGRLSDGWTMLYVTKTMVTINEGQKEVMRPTPLTCVDLAADTDEDEDVSMTDFGFTALQMRF